MHEQGAVATHFDEVAKEWNDFSKCWGKLKYAEGYGFVGRK